MPSEDVDELLEEAFIKCEKKEPRSSGSSRKRSRSRSRDRKSSRSSRDDRGRRGSRERRSHRSPPSSSSHRSSSHGHHRRGRSKSPPSGSSGRGRYTDHRHGGNGFPSYEPTPRRVLTAEEKDARTVFVMQLSNKARRRDIEDFFGAVGKVTDVKMICDNKTGRPKGIAYIEFRDVESVPLAIALTGQKLLGVPMNIQVSQAEKNRMSNQTTTFSKQGLSSMKLYVGNLHSNITDDMIRSIFEPFGKIESVQMIFDDANISKGYAFIQFTQSDDANKAIQQMNGFELAGRPMKVSYVNERHDFSSSKRGSGSASNNNDADELDRAGVDLGTTGRLSLMQKLAEGTGMMLPHAAQCILDQKKNANDPPITTQCLMISNVFNAGDEERNAGQNWDVDIRDDMIDEVNKYGAVLHIYVDKGSSEGNVYVKCPSIACAQQTVNALHGRWFGGRVIQAAYVPLPNYHQLFPESVRAFDALETVNRPANNPPLVAHPAFTK